MGNYYCCDCCLSKEERVATKRSREIDLMLAEEKKRKRLEIQLILIGTSESGKTTFMKQMRIISGEGFSEAERCGYTKLVFQNIFESMRAMTDAMRMLQIPYANPKNEIHAQHFQRNVNQITQLQRSIVEAIHHLWADEGFIICYKRRREYQLLESTKYFIDNLDRITAEDYIPTDQDILRVQSRNVDIIEQCVRVNTITFRFDMVYLRLNRMNQRYHLEKPSWVIFLASLSEFDQLLKEDNKTNRMEESLSVFSSIIQTRRFANCPIILLLNKKDILAEKIQFSDLKTYFPAFKGKPRDVQDALLFIRSLYEHKAASSGTKNSERIYSHVMCATNSVETRDLLNDIKDSIVLNQSREYKLV